MSKYSKFFAILSQANKAGMGMTYKEVVSEFTQGRTDSLNGLSSQELQQLQKNLSHFAPPAKKGHPVEDTMRKAIIAQFLAIDKSVDDAIAWAEKYGVFGRKKLFNDYDRQELWQLIRNAEQMKEDHIRSVAKKMKEGI